MTSSSPEFVAARIGVDTIDYPAANLTPHAAVDHPVDGGRSGHRPALDTADLRSGNWSRFVGASIGDKATEDVLADLAEGARDAATAQGYAAGWAEGRRRAAEAAQAQEEERAVADRHERSRHAAQVDLQVAALQAAAQAVAAQAAAVSAQSAQVVVDAAFELVEAILGRELDVATSPGVDAIARAMTIAAGTPLISVHLHPDDATTLADDMAAQLAAAGTSVVPDPTVGRGSAVAHTDSFSVDATIGSALQRVRRALTA